MYSESSMAHTSAFKKYARLEFIKLKNDYQYLDFTIYPDTFNSSDILFIDVLEQGPASIFDEISKSKVMTRNLKELSDTGYCIHKFNYSKQETLVFILIQLLI